MTHLTPREQQCLQYFLAGKSIKETATALELSPPTVQFYARNMQIKFCCKSQKELLAKIKELEIVI